jgi:hypothetical protein
MVSLSSRLKVHLTRHPVICRRANGNDLLLSALARGWRSRRGRGRDVEYTQLELHDVSVCTHAAATIRREMDDQCPVCGRAKDVKRDG